MTDRLFRAMGRDRDSLRHGVTNGIRADMPFPVTFQIDLGDSVKCDRCGTLYWTGSWPWCRGPGHEKDHER